MFDKALIELDESYSNEENKTRSRIRWILGCLSAVDSNGLIQFKILFYQKKKFLKKTPAPILPLAIIESSSSYS